MLSKIRPKFERHTKWGTFWAFLICIIGLWFHFTLDVLSKHSESIVSNAAMGQGRAIAAELSKLKSAGDVNATGLVNLEVVDGLVAARVLDAGTGDILFSQPKWTPVLPAGTVAIEQNLVKEALRLGVPAEGRITLQDNSGATSKLTRLIFPVSENGEISRFVEMAFDQSRLRNTVDWNMLRSNWDFALLFMLISIVCIMGFWHMNRAIIRKMRLVAHTDELTELPNRSAFSENLDSLTDHDNDHVSHALIILDISKFREINKNAGPRRADQLLVGISRRLSGFCLAQEQYKSIIARLEGDTFGVLVRGLGDIHSTTAFANALLRELQSPLRIDGKEFELRIRMGIALFPRDTTDPAVLMQRAELAHQMARKHAETGIRFHDSATEARYELQQSLERVVMDACEQEDGFEIHYQPLVSIADNRISGFEALIRPVDPDGTPISPGDFIETAEKTGAIYELGRRALEKACTTATHWPSPIKVSVNLSPVQFENGQLVQMVHTVLQKSGLDPERLELEVTEGLMLQHSSGVLAQLTQLKSLGVNIVLDDFGSGYSSMNYLWQFAFNKIKVDRSIVLAMADHDKAREIVTAIVSLVKSMNLPVTAEGVETRSQFEFMAELGCDFAQGFLIGRAIPDMEVAALLIRNFQEGHKEDTDMPNFLEQVSNVMPVRTITGG